MTQQTNDAAYRNNCTKCVDLQKENISLKAKLDATSLKGKLTKVSYKLTWRGGDSEDRTIVKTGFNAINTVCLFVGVFAMDFIKGQGYLLWPILPALLLFNLVKIVRVDDRE